LADVHAGTGKSEARDGRAQQQRCMSLRPAMQLCRHMVRKPRVSCLKRLQLLQSKIDGNMNAAK
jgi:hypothetical protein